MLNISLFIAKKEYILQSVYSQVIRVEVHHDQKCHQQNNHQFHGFLKF
jgi:hypothetical protein